MNRQDLVNSASHAQFLLNELSPIFEQIEKEVIDKGKMLTLGASVSEKELFACFAQLCTIDRIKDELKGRIQRLEYVGKRDPG